MPPPPDRGRRALLGVLAHRAGRPGPLSFLNPNPLLNPVPPLLQPPSLNLTLMYLTQNLSPPCYPHPFLQPLLSPHINKPNTHRTHGPHTRSTTHSRTKQNKKISDILSLSLKLNFNVDTTFPDRDSTAIFNFYYDKTDTQQPQTTQTAPKEEHTMDQTIDTALDETDVATYTEIRQKRQISDGMEDYELLMDNKYTTYVKLHRNYEDSSLIPDNPTKDWFANELDKDHDSDKGPKLFTQNLDHQPVIQFLGEVGLCFSAPRLTQYPMNSLLHFQGITQQPLQSKNQTHNIRKMIPSKLTIIQHNVQSWTNKRIALSNIYNTIDPDIILINAHSLINTTVVEWYAARVLYRVSACAERLRAGSKPGNEYELFLVSRRELALIGKTSTHRPWTHPRIVAWSSPSSLL
ncbi:hypothetical protein FHG87_019034 [Trinorchestia longiramus]|nr:hypothetical protein FHG87_019034 [Trinorchestia longiramus]